MLLLLLQLAQTTTESKQERLATLGIFYDDDYDYEQHLRKVEDLNRVEPDRDVELFRIGATSTVSVRSAAHFITDIFMLKLVASLYCFVSSFSDILAHSLVPLLIH